MSTVHQIDSAPRMRMLMDDLTGDVSTLAN